MALNLAAEKLKIISYFVTIFGYHPCQRQKKNLRDENGLIFSSDHHALESALSNGENMRGHLIPPLTHVDLHGTLGVNGESL